MRSEDEGNTKKIEIFKQENHKRNKKGYQKVQHGSVCRSQGNDKEMEITILLRKENDVTQLTNYRIISLLPYLYKHFNKGIIVYYSSTSQESMLGSEIDMTIFKP